ncbi:CU044_2847 family protein [uncultured Pseudokineococcus sp.]|uniref:CU044_2847 family protein n=1 Tax=uncultured Pseudokineococcus sp. TaxID=1642928 RepID=UPI002621D34D|nr:CU044_2847 family protein [uncultured Pseudokineococcus sp.]
MARTDIELVALEVADGPDILVPVVRQDTEEDVSLADVRVQLKSLLDQVAPALSQIRQAVAHVTPSKTTITFSIGAAWDAGVLKTVLGGPSAELGVQVSLEWEGDA